VQLFDPNEVVADVFAGVGPFAVPAAKKGCAVFANDLNPNSAKYLRKNVEDNRVADLVCVTCEDGRDFIRAVIARSMDHPFPAYTGPKLSARQQSKIRKQKQQLAASDPLAPLSHVITPSLPATLPPRRRISHFVMNLPDSAITFLDAFRGILSSLSSQEIGEVYDTMPMIHCHCFTRETEPDKADVDIRKRVEEQLGRPLGEGVSLHMVRSVAPNKDMYCISFRLPREVAFA